MCAIPASGRHQEALVVTKFATASAETTCPLCAWRFFCTENEVKRLLGWHQARGAPRCMLHVALHGSLHRIYWILKKSHGRYSIQELNYSNVHYSIRFGDTIRVFAHPYFEPLFSRLAAKHKKKVGKVVMSLKYNDKFETRACFTSSKCAHKQRRNVRTHEKLPKDQVQPSCLLKVSW